MADLEISIPYKNLTIWAMQGLTLTTFPIWGLLAPLVILALLVSLSFSIPVSLLAAATVPASQLGSVLTALPSWHPFVYAAFAAAITYAGIRAVILTGDKNIVLNEQGISFPANYFFALKFRRRWSWEELLAIEIKVPTGRGLHTGTLALRFDSGQVAKIKLKSLSPAHIEQLLLGIRVWTKNNATQEQVTGLLEQLNSPLLNDGQTSYTQIWEEEINRHFSSTAFVPLQEGASLQSGRISVIKPLAFGGLSAVYLAQRGKTETVILKELVIDHISDQTLFQKAETMFKREAELLMKLNDKRVAHVLDYFNENGRSYLVLEQIRGENLRDIIRQSGAQPEQIVIDWAKQLASILKYIHEQDPPMIHRDLTPDNIVLRQDGHIALIDFGAANEYLGTATGTIVGKQSYISPEQFRGKATTQSDIYSFGATLFFMLTGQDPEPLSQSSIDTQSVMVSEGMNKLLQDSTELTTEKRPSSANELLDRLSKLTGEGQLIAGPSSHE